MDLLSLVVVLAVIGFCLWLVVTFIPMPPPFKQAIVALVVLVLVIYLARLLLGGHSITLR